MSRALTRREKVLMTVLALLLMALAYYLLVYQPVREELASIRSGMQDMESRIALEQAKAVRLEQMREQLESLGHSEESGLTPMAEYDNAQNVMAALASVLSSAAYYDLSFSPVAADGRLVRRSIGMTFGCAGYADAREILRRLAACPYRCSIGDFSITAEPPAAAAAEPDLTRDSVRVSLTVTFYELTQE